MMHPSWECKSHAPNQYWAWKPTTNWVPFTSMTTWTSALKLSTLKPSHLEMLSVRASPQKLLGLSSQQSTSLYQSLQTKLPLKEGLPQQPKSKKPASPPVLLDLSRGLSSINRSSRATNLCFKLTHKPTLFNLSHLGSKVFKISKQVVQQSLQDCTADEYLSQGCLKLWPRQWPRPTQLKPLKKESWRAWRHKEFRHLWPSLTPTLQICSQSDSFSSRKAINPCPETSQRQVYIKREILTRQESWCLQKPPRQVSKVLTMCEILRKSCSTENFSKLRMAHESCRKSLRSKATVNTCWRKKQVKKSQVWAQSPAVKIKSSLQCTCWAETTLEICTGRQNPSQVYWCWLVRSKRSRPLAH